MVSITTAASIAKIHFDDGSIEEGNLIVGCDGSRSKVREFLLGKAAKPTDVGLHMINYIASGYTREQALLLRMYHPVLKLGYHPDIQGIFLLGSKLLVRNFSSSLY